jgi:magnesium chelatase family protein
MHGPLLDRIDLHIEVLSVEYKDTRRRNDGPSSTDMRARVFDARMLQQRRGFYYAHLSSRDLPSICAFDEAGERTLELAVRRMGLRARAHDRILKVARTVADLDHSHPVTAKHLAEAVQYRILDRSYWS